MPALCVRRVYKGGATRPMVIGDVYFFSSLRYRKYALTYCERSLVVLCGGYATLHAKGRLAVGAEAVVIAAMTRSGHAHVPWQLCSCCRGSALYGRDNTSCSPFHIVPGRPVC